ncbi:hypothetical protein RJ639_028001 [Escallonia herrerae]|uniref:DNA-directed RNA polymerase subunit n=1 Tax=Escallonia herrerae TaxID=1293975 RepID=A0AA89BQV1_9ASTE|nr:hypothetical protein RJ639_028001 [Escallonia herrerae]
MEGLKVSDAKMTVYLHPSKARNASQAIFRELSSLLFKFNETFDGVVLAYEVNILSNLAKILPTIHPYFGVRLKAKLLLFNPKPDMLLEGKVVKLGQQSIHIIVLGFSSATVILEDMREEFRYRVKHGKEVYVSASHKRHIIEVGTIIRFVVKSFEEEVLHISGSLLPAHTGNARWLDKNVQESQADSTKKRKESDRSQIRDLKKEMVEAEIYSLKTNNRSKKSKRRTDDS